MQRTHSCDNMPRLLNKTHCIVGKLVLGKERILLMAYEQAEKNKVTKIHSGRTELGRHFVFQIRHA